VSTRSMVVLRGGKGQSATIFLYRHMDGYPACAGLDLAEAIGDNTQIKRPAAQLARKLLDLRYEKQDYQEKASSIYELADWLPEEQGDLEHVYRVLGAGTSFARVAHFQRANWQHDSWLDWPSQSYSPDEFLAFTKRESEALEERAKARELELAGKK